MNKKAMSSVIVFMILGLVIIAFSIPIINYIRKTSDTSMTKDWNINPQDDFRPADYTSNLNSDERLADASMKALVLAINSISSGRSIFDSSSVVPSDIEDFKISYSVTYEDKARATYPALISTSMSQTNGEPEIWTYMDVLSTQISVVKNIDLYVKYADGTVCDISTKEDGEDDTRLTELKDWGGESGSCKNSQTWLQCPLMKIYYCGKKGAKDFEGSKVYDSNGKSTSKVKTLIEFNNKLEQNVSKQRLGELVIISQKFGRLVTRVSNALSKVPLIGISSQSNYERSKAFCYGGKKIEGTNITVKCDDGGATCYICNFELPQNVSTPEWITGFGDPQYLSYYESFPEGSNTYWQYSTVKSAGIIGGSMIFAGGINYITSKMGVRVTSSQIKEGAEQGTKKLAQNFGKTIVNEGLKEVTEDALIAVTNKVGKKGIESVVKTGIFKNSLVGIVKSTENKPVNSYLSDVFESYLTKAANDASKSTFKSSTKLAKEIEETAIANFEKDLPNILANNKNTLIKDFGYKGNILNYNKDQIDTLSPQIMSELRNSMSQNVDKKLIQEFMVERSTMNAFKTLMNKEGTVFSKEAVEEAMKSSNQIVKSLEGLSPSYQKAIYDRTNDRLQKLMYNDGIVKRSQNEFFEGLDNVGTSIADKDLSAIKDYLMAQGKATGVTLKESISGGSGYAPTSGWIDGPYLPLKLSTNPLTLLNPVTQTKQAAQFLWGKRYTMMFGVALLAEYQDTVNEKFGSGGTNSIVLGAPSVLGEKKRVYDLEDSALKYYIALHERYKNEKGIETTRFYLASPCKTDLVIKKQVCTCMRRPEALHYNFGGGPIDVKKGTLTIEPSTLQIKNEIEGIIVDGNAYYQNSLLNNNELTTRYSRLTDYIDDSNAIKICESRSMMQSIYNFAGNVETADYKTECIVVEPYVLDTQGSANYCYPRYPSSNTIKSSVSTIVIVGSVVGEVLTGGIATPIVVVVGVGEAVVQSAITELYQKWPRADSET